MYNSYTKQPGATKDVRASKVETKDQKYCVALKIAVKDKV